MIFVTGGAGFIGANFILDFLAQNDEPVINVDNLTCSGNIVDPPSVREDASHVFMQADISSNYVPFFAHDVQGLSGTARRNSTRNGASSACGLRIAENSTSPASIKLIWSVAC